MSAVRCYPCLHTLRPVCAHVVVDTCGLVARRFALEGSIPVAGVGIRWLINNLGIVSDVREFDEQAASVDSAEGVYVHGRVRGRACQFLTFSPRKCPCPVASCPRLVVCSRPIGVPMRVA